MADAIQRSMSDHSKSVSLPRSRKSHVPGLRGVGRPRKIKPDEIVIASHALDNITEHLNAFRARYPEIIAEYEKIRMKRVEIKNLLRNTLRELKITVAKVNQLCQTKTN